MVPRRQRKIPVAVLSDPWADLLPEYSGFVDAAVCDGGLRQGCGLSPLLFLLVAEVMANAIRPNNLIEGISINSEGTNKESKLSQLADDTTLFPKSNNSIEHGFTTIKLFGEKSGLDLNLGKTKGIPLGNIQLSNEIIDKLEWSDKVKTLGAYFGKNKQECENLNWESKIETCKHIINNWNKRNLTIYGRLTVIKSILLPKFTYLFQSLCFPDSYLKKLNTLMFDFL